MHRMAKRFAEGVQSVIDEYDLSWQVILLGSRLEYLFTKEPPKMARTYMKRSMILNCMNICIWRL